MGKEAPVEMSPIHRVTSRDCGKHEDNYRVMVLILDTEEYIHPRRLYGGVSAVAQFATLLPRASHIAHGK